MSNIKKLEEVTYRLENITSDDDVEALVIEYTKIQHKINILNQKMKKLIIDSHEIDNDVYNKALDRVEEKIEHLQLEKLVNETMEYMVNEYSMESLSNSGNYYYVDIDSRLLIVTATLNKDGFYALQDIDNLKKVITTNFIENTILDINLYRDDKMYMKHDGITYNLDINNMEREFIQDGIYEHFCMDVDYNVDFDKVFIEDLEDGRYILNLAITFNAGDWDKMIEEIEKGKEDE